MRKEDKRLAFPAIKIESNPGYDPIKCYHPGMSLRQWYAGMAMMGMASMLADPGVDFSFQDCARMSYKQADAMLKEGAKQDE